MKRLIVIALVMATFAACTKRHDDPSMGLDNVRALDGVPDRYRPIYDGVLGYREDGSREVLPFETITLERTGCFGSCPAYKVTFFRTGDSRLEARAHMAIHGDFEGRVDVRTFARLCFAIERSGFAGFKNDYRAPWTDDATCVVTVTTKKGRKSVSDYGEVGPIGLWVIQSAIDRVREETTWKPVKEPIQPPQRNAGSRPSSGDSSASETPSALGPRG